MLAWIRSPRGSTTTATVVGVILLMSWLAPWSQPMAVRLPFAAWGPDGDSTPAPSRAPDAAAIPRPADAAQGTPPSTAATASLAPRAVGATSTKSVGPETASRADAANVVPSFDIVRVEPNGEAVIAGRAEPGSTVRLLDGDKQLAQVAVDANGQFAFLPPRLDEGNHYLSLTTQKAGQASLKSAQGVAVAVARNGGSKPLVALLSPDAPTRVLSDGAAVEPSGAEVPGAPAPVLPVTIQSVEAGRGGQFMASGVAHPGHQCRVYLNGAYLADVTAGKDGRWSVAIQKGMKPGRYTVRADELAPGGASVMHRAEVPFDYPVSVAGRAGSTGRQQLMSRANQDGTSRNATDGGASAARTTRPDIVASNGSAPIGAGTDAAVITNLGTATVTRGDSLWRISKKMLGHGIQYTEIYATNVQQIRDPALIYPGQVFVVPSRPTK